MISWALKRRNSESAPDAPGPDDTTQIDLPDTPAPVFAVRALKTALFGTPAPKDRRPAPKTKEKTPQPNGHPAPQPASHPAPPTDKSPAKPAGILLTPGTGTTRRKRVTFGYDVKQGSGGTARASTVGLFDESPSKGAPQSRPITKLRQAMESSRKGSTKENGTDEKDFAYQRHSMSLREGSTKENGTDEKDFAYQASEQEDGWEEVEDESDFEPDITTDLNEPHSRSGKYWKSYFETYHTDAKTEMEKLVKYKHLAKSYAKMKDAESLELHQKLNEEQEKVKTLEAKVAEMGGQVPVAAKKRGGKGDLVSMDELNKQTALAKEYKLQVEELEAVLQSNIDEAGDEYQRQPRTASPRTQRTLMEAQRELRRARSQVRELERLQEERVRLRSELAHTEQRASKLEEENRELLREMSRSTSRIQDLEMRLEDSKGTYEKLKDDAKARYLEAQQVLQKKNGKISELEEEVESLKRGGAEAMRSNRSTRAKSFDEKATALRSLEPVEKESDQLRKGLDELKRAGNYTGTTASTTKAATAAETRQRDKRSIESFKRASQDEKTLAQSRALREKLEAQFGTKGLPASSVFSDRGNLQDSHSSASSGRSAHSREHEPYTRRTTKPPRSASAAASTGKPTVGDLLARARDKRAGKTSLGQQPRRVPARPLSPESDTSPNVGHAQGNDGGADAQNSAVWSTMNTSRTALPEHRKKAALARIQQRIAERKMLQQQLGRDKENARP